MLKREGIHLNHKKVYRLYKEIGLVLPTRIKKKKYFKRAKPIKAISKKNIRWAMDFLYDRTLTGINLKILTVIDIATRECLALYTDRCITGEQVARILNQVSLSEGFPKEILSDNGPEFISKAMNLWAKTNTVSQIFIEPGKPGQNGHCESFNGKLRLECLNQKIF